MNSQAARREVLGPYRKRFPITLYPILEPLHFVLLGLAYAYLTLVAARSAEY